MSLLKTRLVGTAVLLVASLGGCATMPGRIDAIPPKPFRSDGCTLFPDWDYRTCCDAHDLAYWCGGTRTQRVAADRELVACVRNKGHRLLPHLVHPGIRLGGAPWLPTPWRWGFGWSYFRSYTDSPMSCVSAGGH